MRSADFTMLSGFALTLWVLTCVMWVRSYFVTDYYQNETQDGYRVNIASEDGYIARWEIGIRSRPAEHAWLEHHPEGISLQVKLAYTKFQFNRPYWNLFLASGIVGFWPWLRRIPLLQRPVHMF